MKPAHLATVFLAASFAASLPTFAQSGYGRPHRGYQSRGEAWEFFVGGVATDYDQAVEINDDIGLSLRFGYLFNWMNEMEFLFNDVATNDSAFPDINVETSQFQVAYVLNFTHSNVVPYATAGLGWFHTDDDALGTETDPVLGLGGGIRFFIGPRTHLRAEYRYNRFSGSGRVYADNFDVAVREFTFGVGWRFPVR